MYGMIHRMPDRRDSHEKIVVRLVEQIHIPLVHLVNVGYIRLARTCRLNYRRHETLKLSQKLQSILIYPTTMSCRQPLDLDAHSGFAEKRSAQTSTTIKEERFRAIEQVPGGDQVDTTTPQNASMPVRPES